MDTVLPKMLDPGRLAAKSEMLAGTLPAASVSRLTALYDIADPVEVSLRFTPAGFGRLSVSGELRGILRAQCQRCLQPVRVQISHVIGVTVTDLDQTERKDAHGPAEDFDDAVEYRTKIDIHDLVEDELVLASPIIPQHQQGTCSPPDGGVEAKFAGIEQTQKQEFSVRNRQDRPLQSNGNKSGETTRPFAGLAELLSSKD